MIPALLFTAVLDLVGQYYLGSDFYVGAYPDFYSGPSAGGQFDVTIFLGNAVFLQEILVLAFGSNGPLWSISYEFWYYILFPIALLALYLTHFPTLALLSALRGNYRSQSLSEGWPLFVLWLVLSGFVAVVFWYIFERNTGKVRVVFHKAYQATLGTRQKKGGSSL